MAGAASAARIAGAEQAQRIHIPAAFHMSVRQRPRGALSVRPDLFMKDGGRLGLHGFGGNLCSVAASGDSTLLLPQQSSSSFHGPVERPLLERVDRLPVGV